MNVGRLALLGVSALLVGGLGYLIKNRRAMELVAGYDPETVQDEDGLAVFVGTNLYYVAALTLLMGIADALGLRALWGAYALALAGLTLRLWRGTSRYESG